MTEAIRVVPANEASWEDLQSIFGRRGSGARCWCQRYKMAPGENFAGVPAEERGWLLRQQIANAVETSGLVAYVADEPAGWCAVEPRPAYDSLVRHSRVVWTGRDEDKADNSVWAVTCVFARTGYRKRGVSRALVAASVPFARGRGARALEGYPINTTQVIEEELHVGTVSTFEAAGFRIVSRPTPRRVVMRIDF
ncbi:MAG: GNAT family N-acetyltransferase [Thermoleophilaceae bacterium]|nr:GNAT family N-acetyltransferase [Thermoleophilaceae bacterium]